MVLEIWCATDSFFSFWTGFCPSNPKIQNFEKIKNTKTLGDIIAFIIEILINIMAI